MNWCKKYEISLKDYILRDVRDESSGLRFKYYISKLDPSLAVTTSGTIGTQNYFIEYTKNGKMHREGNLPARVEIENGKLKNLIYCVNGKLHKENGPCSYRVAYGTTRVFWCIDNKFCRFDGPAYIVRNLETNEIEEEAYYLYDFRMKKEEYNKLIQNVKNCNMKMVNCKTNELKLERILLTAKHFNSEKLVEKCTSLLIAKKLTKQH